MTTAYLDWKQYSEFVFEVFKAYGVPEEDAKICTDVLTQADKKGFDSHGANRLKPLYIDYIKDKIQYPESKWKIIKESPTTAVIDGGHGMGQVISYHAMKLAMKKAKEFGLGMVAVKNSSHYGIAGYYTDMAANEDLIGVSGSNTRPVIAPTFSIESKIGTNPFTWSMPTDESFPFSFDAATSTTAIGKIEVLEREGKDLADNVVIDSTGKSIHNATEAVKKLKDGSATITPLGGIGEALSGYKGYGFAIIVELLSSALQQGVYLDQLAGTTEEGHKPKGHFFMAIDPEAFMGKDVFKKTAGDILRELRSSQLAPNADRIFTAGEKEYLIWQERQKTGLPINESIQKDLIFLRDEAQLDFTFPFE